MGKRDMDIDPRPVFIAGSPRSGTTMLAGLLVKHGFWVGKSRVTKDSSSNSLIATENIPIKKVMKDQLRTIGHKNRQVPFPTEEEVSKLDLDKIWAMVQRVVPKGEPWLLKTGGLLLFYEFWNEKFPEARWVFPRRAPQDIVESIKRHKYMKFNESVIEFVHMVFDRQVVIEQKVANSLYVDVKSIANRNEACLKSYFNFCGVEMNESIVHDFINPKMMH